jgi:4a-hydroxytetrahydrobiopterin dehydratase
MSEFAARSCTACTKDTPPVSFIEALDYLHQLVDWELEGETLLTRQFRFADFRTAIDFINAVADLAEAEGHHPDIHLTRYNHVRIDLMTHVIRALSENDFILAAKIDRLFPKVG